MQNTLMQRSLTKRLWRRRLLLGRCGFALVCLLFLGCVDQSSDPDPALVQAADPHDAASITAPRKFALSKHVGINPQGALERYIGSETCGGCHTQAYTSWLGSHHQLAMAEPTAKTVIGDFADQTHVAGSVTSKFLNQNGVYSVVTDGAENKLTEYAVRYTFGISPLQQYLVDVGSGRLQALPLVWDARGADVQSLNPNSSPNQRWYHLAPQSAGAADAPTHWTRGGQNWNHMCADCHSTAVTKGYDAATDTFNTQFAEISVGCEACHGPGSSHRDSPTQPYPMRSSENSAALAEQNTCATCHSRRAQLAEGFTPQQAFLDHYQPAFLEQGLYHPDGQILDEVYVYGSFAQSKMHAQGVTCSNCHDAHSAQLKFQGDALCTQCHNPAGREEFPTLTKALYDSPSHHFHNAVKSVANSGAACVDCHMTSQTYMGIDERHDHSFRIPRPDLSEKIGVPNACAGCHEVEQGPNVNRWAAEVIADHFKHAQKPPKPEHFGEALFAARRGQKTAETGLVAVAVDSQMPGIVRGTALSLLGGYALTSGSRAIEVGLKSADPLVRMGAIRGSERWPGQRQWRALKPLLDDPLLAVRLEVVAALADLYPALPPPEQAVLKDSIEAYIDVQLVSADRAESLSNIASMYLSMGDMVRAERTLKRALKLNAQWVPALINLADIYRATGRDEQGVTLLDTALELTPSAPDVLLAKALWWVRQGDRTRAIGLLAQGYNAQSVSSLNYIYAVALHSNGDTAKALAVVDAAIDAGLSANQLVQLGLSITRETADLERARRYQVYISR
ncbi:multiheme c-type cytochrome [Pseudomonadales bacterium]|nr:multiheme c-type cytochrome [Pseudomonadales bacterium]